MVHFVSHDIMYFHWEVARMCDCNRYHGYHLNFSGQILSTSKIYPHLEALHFPAS